MKKLVENNFGKLSVVLQHSLKIENIELDNSRFIKIKKIKSDKISSHIFYKPISKII